MADQYNNNFYNPQQQQPGQQQYPNNYQPNYEQSQPYQPQSQQYQPSQQQQQQQPSQQEQYQALEQNQSQKAVDNGQGVFRENNETAKTFNTEMRRRYPIDKMNKKSEWIGVEKHLSEVNEEIRKNEIEINQLRQKELLSELDKKVMQKLWQKQQELTYKKREHEEILRRMAIYQQEDAQSKEDKRLFQQNMAESYLQQKTDQQRKELEQKYQKNEWENKLLDYNQQRIQEEQRRNREHKEFLKNSVQNDYQRAQARKLAEKQSEMQNKMEYNDLIQMNAERELTKEENYRNFYRMAAENQQKLHENHFNNVFMPLAKKQKELEDMISKSCTEAERRRLQTEIDRIQRQKNGLLETKEKNQYMMGEKQYLTELEKNLKEQQVKERLEDLQNYQQYQDFKRKEDQDGKKKYKEFLDQQFKERQDILMNEERMTRNEKGLNRLDLQAYKMYDNGLYTMLPGWAPQIGQLPPRQNREVLQEQIMDKIRKQGVPEGGDANPLATASSQNNGSMTSPHSQNRTLAKAAQNSLVMQSHPNLGQFQKIGESEKRYDNPLNYGQAYEVNGQLASKGSSPVMSYGHNPIYNPMPFNNQNPYLSKELQRAGNRQGYNNSQGRYPAEGLK